MTLPIGVTKPTEIRSEQAAARIQRGLNARLESWMQFLKSAGSERLFSINCVRPHNQGTIAKRSTERENCVDYRMRKIIE